MGSSTWASSPAWRDAAALPAADLEAELRRLLRLRAGNVSAVAREMGKARMQIHRWMTQFGIKTADFRGDGAGEPDEP